VDGSLEQLFTKIRDTMPPGSSTTLSDTIKIDILAYVLERNALPAGDRDLLPAGAELDAIRVTRRGIWQGVYTEAQAARGKSTFETTCVRCHGADLTGVTAPPLSGESFIANWETGSVGNLFAKIRDTMPPDGSATLEGVATLDIVAYLLQNNAFPPGPAELTLDGEALDSVQILRKGATPVVPNFAMVQMVGCLEAGPDDRWVLTSSSAPSTTRERSVAPGELERAGRRPLGEETYTLVSAGPFSPASRQGHKVAVKGLLYRQPDAHRINLTALETVADTCEDQQ
jgi:mono/diheme cytochrome c family protein